MHWAQIKDFSVKKTVKHARVPLMSLQLFPPKPTLMYWSCIAGTFCEYHGREYHCHTSSVFMVTALSFMAELLQFYSTTAVRMVIMVNGGTCKSAEAQDHGDSLTASCTIFQCKHPAVTEATMVATVKLQSTYRNNANSTDTTIARCIKINITHAPSDNFIHVPYGLIKVWVN